MFGKIRRADWLPVRQTKQDMEQDQIDRSEGSDSDNCSDEEEAMARAYDCDDYGTDLDDGSDCEYLLTPKRKGP